MVLSFTSQRQFLSIQSTESPPSIQAEKEVYPCLWDSLSSLVQGIALQSLLCQLWANGWGLSGKQRKELTSWWASGRQRSKSRQCPTVLSAVKRKAAGRAHTRQEGGCLGRGDREPLWGSGLCACWLPLPQQGRIFAETAIPKTDITHRPRGHMCPVRCQYLTSGPQGQGYKLLLHR